MPKFTRYWPVAALALAAVFAWTVWPTPWRHFSIGEAPWRENRFTGDLWRLTTKGWVRAGPQPPALTDREIELVAELRKRNADNPGRLVVIDAYERGEIDSTEFGRRMGLKK